jgi:endoglucanase
MMTFPARRSAASRPAIALAALGLLLASVTTPSGVANAHSARHVANPTNPLAGVQWGVYKGGQDGVYPAYAAASGAERALLAKVALQPRARWYGSWLSTAEMRAKLNADIAAQRADTANPDVLVPVAFFRQFPGHERNRNIPWTVADRQAYRGWYDAAAAAIGAAHALIILEPDLPATLKGWRPDIRARLVTYAARTLAALPNTVIYLDGGASDWLKPDQQAALLKSAGVQYVRGFAENGTHYTSTADNIRRGRETLAALAKLGITGKHFVIDTSDNGRPFGFGEYYEKHPNGFFPNAEPCQTKTETKCVTLGIPPTWRVADPAWHLPSKLADVAKRLVDGYVWYNRPWLKNATVPFDLNRTLQMARTTPFQ